MTPRQLAARAKRLWDNFSLTIENWDVIFQFQGAVCAICKKSKKVYHTDHDHTPANNGLVRGILCGPCNRALGKVQDPRWSWTADCFENAAIYLRRPPAVDALGHPTYSFPGKIGTKRFRLWLKKKKSVSHTNIK